MDNHKKRSCFLYIAAGENLTNFPGPCMSGTLDEETYVVETPTRRNTLLQMTG